MNKYSNTEKDIHKRIYKFILNCFRDVVKQIPNTIENAPIKQQLASSLTSIGANDQEADAAGSRKDFIAKYLIVKKEAKETYYWLCFIRDSVLVKELTVSPYITECKEILLIVSKIIENAR
jgi:four helix bundle protein